MASWLRARHSAITFDLGAAGIRAYQVGQRGPTPHLGDALAIERPLPDGATPPALPAIDGAQLSRLIDQGGFTGRDVALVVSPPEVQFFPVHLPNQALAQTPERIEQALKWEVAQQSRAAADELEVRYWRLPGGRSPQANVMAVAMPAKTALEWCLALQQHRLVLRRIDVSPSALVHLAHRAWTPGPNDLWGILDLGLRHSTLTLVIGAVPTYVRSLSVAVHQWTQQVATAFEVAYPTAEQVIRQHGVRPSTRGVGPDTNGRNLMDATDLTSALSSVLRDSLHTLAQEVGRCFAYLMQSFPEHTVRQLLLAGGGAELRGLAAVLAGELDIPVRPLATAADPALPWEHAIPGVRCTAPAAAALGAALADLEAA